MDRARAAWRLRTTQKGDERQDQTRRSVASTGHPPSLTWSARQRFCWLAHSPDARPV